MPRILSTLAVKSSKVGCGMRIVAIVFFSISLMACSERAPNDAASDPVATPVASLDELARQYVLLELAMGQHDPDHVDAWFGPESWQQEAIDADLSLEQITAGAQTLREKLAALDTAGDQGVRRHGLIKRLDALGLRVRLAQGDDVPFDQETATLYDATVPDYTLADFEQLLADIDALLPGEGSVADRVTAYEAQFVIPNDRIDAVFTAAIDECRRRTLQHIDLPESESFTVEYVTDKPWSGYNWYQGNAFSLIQINTSLPIMIDRAVDLGCHEGYPGHHTYNALLEQNLVKDRGWIEFAIYPLFSPQSLIAEGSANYGIDLAFPGDERLQFERDVLYPLAGLDAGDAPRFERLQRLKSALNHIQNMTARDYLDGRIGAQQAEDQLMRLGLLSPQKAKQRVSFMDTYRSYVINYNLGQDLVRAWVEANSDSQPTRWATFKRLLSEPLLASDLH